MGVSSNIGETMDTDQAKRASEYLTSMNQVLSENASAEEYRYQASVLRNNKDIYQTQLGLNLASLNADVDASKQQLYQQEIQLRISTANQVLLQQNKISQIQGAQQEQELSGAIQVKNAAIQATQDVKTQLYGIRKDATAATSKMSADFINRGFGSSSTNARTMIYNDLDDREYQSRLVTDYALLSTDNAQQNYLQMTAQQRANMGLDINAVNLQITGLNQDMNAQIDLYRTQLESIDTKANIQAQSLTYDSLVKTYQDETQAKLYDYKSKTQTSLAKNSLLSAQLKLASSDPRTSRIKVEDYGSE